MGEDSRACVSLLACMGTVTEAEWRVRQRGRTSMDVGDIALWFLKICAVAMMIANYMWDRKEQQKWPGKSARSSLYGGPPSFGGGCGGAGGGGSC